MVETKYTEHRIVINKFTKAKTLMGSSDERKPLRKVVRIAYSDYNATDSSSDEEEGDRSRGVFKKTRVKRFVNEVRIVECDDSAARKLNSRASCKSKKQEGHLVKRNDGTGKNFKGVRQRQWGRWAAEIRNPFSKGRLWLGTYDTAEEAAMAYDKKSIELRGPAAFTNLIKPVLEPKKPLSPSPSPQPEADIGTDYCYLDEFAEMNNESSKLDHTAMNFDYDSGFESQALHSPTSVLRYQPVELRVEPTDTNEWRPTVDFREEEESIWIDEAQDFRGWLGIDSETTLPIFYDGIREPSENFSDISLDSHQDFRSCTWDVDQYFRDQPLPLQ